MAEDNFIFFKVDIPYPLVENNHDLRFFQDINCQVKNILKDFLNQILILILDFFSGYNAPG